MNLLIYALYWVSFTVLFASGQGLLMPAIRRTPQGTEANRQSFALHWLFGTVWAMPLCFTPEWHIVLMALLIRFSLFDPALNLAAGDELFNVGKESNTDKLLHWIAGKLRISAPALSATLKALVFLFLCTILWINN